MAHGKRKTGDAMGSTELGIVAPRRSSREIFLRKSGVVKESDRESW